MRLYTWLNRLFPRSFTAKMFLLAFLGIHLPLIALIGKVLIGAGPLSAHLDVLLLLLAATLLGTVATLLALRAVMQPLYRIETTLRLFEAEGVAPLLPGEFQDEVGRLMARTNRLMLAVGQRLDASTRAAETDPLTGLLNRRGLARQVMGPVRGGLLYLDIDHFKAVNDDLGHAMGDRVLHDVAEAIRAALRQGDLSARHGGEEFVILLPGAAPDVAQSVAERLRQGVHRQVQAGARPVSVSIGVAASAEERPLATLLAMAEAACRQAKAEGRNRVVAQSRIPTPEGRDRSASDRLEADGLERPQIRAAQTR